MKKPLPNGAVDLGRDYYAITVANGVNVYRRRPDDGPDRFIDQFLTQASAAEWVRDGGETPPVGTRRRA